MKMTREEPPQPDRPHRRGVRGGVGAGLLFTFEYPPVLTVQTGFRGRRWNRTSTPRREALAAVNQVPAPGPCRPGRRPGKPEVHQNVQVLGDLNENEFIRVMSAITEWVSPNRAAPIAMPKGRNCRRTRSTPRSCRAGCSR